VETLKQFAQAFINKLSDVADYVVDEFQYYGIDISFLSRWAGSQRRELSQDPFDMLKQSFALGSKTENPLDALYPGAKASRFNETSAVSEAAPQMDGTPHQTVSDEQKPFATAPVNVSLNASVNGSNGANPFASAQPPVVPQASTQNAQEAPVHSVIYLDRIAMGKALSHAFHQGGIPLMPEQMTHYFVQQPAAYGQPQPNGYSQAYQEAYGQQSGWVMNGKRPAFGLQPMTTNAAAPHTQGTRLNLTSQTMNSPHFSGPAPQWYANPKPSLAERGIQPSTDPESVKIILDSYKNLSKSMDSLLNRYFTVMPA
jgi:hypothetical protein